MSFEILHRVAVVRTVASGGIYRKSLQDNESRIFLVRNKVMPQDGRRREPLATAPPQS
jgi:hypothetical protein